MKKIFFLLLFIYSTSVSAQFKLSGIIKNYNGSSELKINIPLVYGFDDANSIKIPVAKNGTFAITLPAKTTRFGDLVFEQNFHLILQKPGKNLKVELNNQQPKGFKLAGGTALPENLVLQKINVEEYPFFLQNDGAYTNLSPADLNNKLVKPYFAMRDKKIAAVNQSAINPKDKKLIIGEIKAAAYNNLYELVLLGGDTHEKMVNLMISALDQADPKPEVFPPGPQYYLFANNYLWYKQTKSAIKVKAQNIKSNQPMPDYGITVAEFNAFNNKYGQVYIRWLSATRFLPNPVIEQLGYLLVSNAIKSGNKDLVNELVKDYKRKFPHGQFIDGINRQTIGLKH